MTLVEVMISVVLVTLCVGGLYKCGILAEKTALYNELSSEVNALVLQKLEETVALPYADIAARDATVLDTQINSLRGNRVLRTTSIIGHLANGSTTMDLANSDYLEVHTTGIFVSPISRRWERRTVSTLVYNPQ